MPAPAPSTRPDGAPPPDRDALVRLLARHAEALGPADPHAITLDGPVHSGRYSTVYRARVPGIGTPLAVKVVIDPVSGMADSAAAATQHAALERVHRAMPADPKLRVPRPYLVDRPEGTLVLEWVGGAPMTELLLSLRTSPAAGLALMTCAGRWLRRFASAHPLPRGHLDVDEKLSALVELERSGLGASRGVAGAIATLRRHAGLAAALELERSWLHGDFKTDNLLVDGDSLVAIDVHARHENVAAYDVAAFLNHLDLTLCHPRAWRWRPWRRRLAREFLLAFDPGLLAHARVAYAWTALYLMVSNLREFTGRRRPSLQHVYLARCFGTLIRRMTSELDGAAREA